MFWARTALLAVLVAGTSSAYAQGLVASIVDLEIVPDKLDAFLAALRENGAASVKEPGCRRYDVLQSSANPNQIMIYEVYENQALSTLIVPPSTSKPMSLQPKSWWRNDSRAQ